MKGGSILHFEVLTARGKIGIPQIDTETEPKRATIGVDATGRESLWKESNLLNVRQIFYAVESSRALGGGKMNRRGQRVFIVLIYGVRADLYVLIVWRCKFGR